MFLGEIVGAIEASEETTSEKKEQALPPIIGSIAENDGLKNSRIGRGVGKLSRHMFLQCPSNRHRKVDSRSKCTYGSVYHKYIEHSPTSVRHIALILPKKKTIPQNPFRQKSAHTRSERCRRHVTQTTPTSSESYPTMPSRLSAPRRIIQTPPLPSIPQHLLHLADHNHPLSSLGS